MKNLLKTILIFGIGLTSCATLPKKTEELKPMNFYLDFPAKELHLGYDTDGDRREDLRKVYSMTDADGYGNIWIEYKGHFDDLNRDGFFSKEEEWFEDIKKQNDKIPYKSLGKKIA